MTSFLDGSTATIVLRQYHLSGDVSAVPSSLPAAPDPFVGREEEMQTLRRRLLAGPRLVFLTGPGGIGKTTLALTMAHRMWQSGYFSDGVLWVDAREVLSYGGFLDDLERQLGQRPGKERSLDERAQHLVRQIAEHDYLLVIDDLGALGGGRRPALQLLRQLPGAVIVTTRLHPPGVDVPERLNPLPIADVQQLLHTLTAQPFPPDESQRLLRQLEGSPLAAHLAAARLDDGESVTQLIEKIVHAPTGQLHMGSFHGQTPGVLRTLLVALEGLRESQKRLLFASSVLRRSYVASLLAYVVAGREDAEGVVDDLKALHRRGFVEHTLRGWRVHGALVEVLERYNALPADEWHRRAAEVLSRGTLEEQLVAAAHLRQAGDAPRAAALLVERSEVLMEAGLVSQLAEQLGAFSLEAVGGDLWLQLNEKQGDAAAHLQAWWEASRYYERALSQMQGLPPSEANRAVAARLSRKRAEVILDEGGRDGKEQSIEEAERWLTRALRVVPPTEGDELVRLALLQSHLHERKGNYQEAVQAAERALHLARQHGTNNLLLACYQRVGDLYRHLEQDHIALSAYDSALAVASLEENSREQAILLTALGESQRDQGNWMDAVEAFEDSLPHWRRTNLAEPLASTLYQLGSLLVRQGRYAEAQQALQEAQIIARRLGLVALIVMIRASVAEILMRQGDPQVAGAMLKESLDEAQRHMLSQPLPALYRLRAETLQQASHHAEATQLRRQASIWAHRNDDTLERYRVLVAGILADGDADALEGAINMLPDRRALYEQAHLQLRLAEHLINEEITRAHHLLLQLSDTLSRLGARPEIARVTLLLGRLNLAIRPA